MPDIQRLPGPALRGDVLRPDLVLVLRQVGRFEAGGTALDNGQAVEQDGAAGGAHRGVVLEPNLGRDAAIGIGDDIKGDAQRADDRHVEADLVSERPLAEHFEIAARHGGGEVLRGTDRHGAEARDVHVDREVVALRQRRIVREARPCRRAARHQAAL